VTTTGRKVGAFVGALAVATWLVVFATQQGHKAGAVSPFATPHVVTGMTSPEPGINIRIDPNPQEPYPENVEIYVSGPIGRNAPSVIFKLDQSPVFDPGAEWFQIAPGQRAMFPGGFAANISVDLGRAELYMTDLGTGTDTVSRSGNPGTPSSWQAQPFGSVAVDRPWVSAAGNGDVYLATHRGSGLWVSRSVSPNEGLNYSMSSLAATTTDQENCGCASGNLITQAGKPPGLLGLGSTDNVGLIYPTGRGGVKFARSTDGGMTYVSSVVSGDKAGIDTAHNFPVVARVGGNVLVAVWLEIGAGSDQVMFNSSQDFGKTWGSPKAIVPLATGTSVFPWVAAGTDSSTGATKVAVSLYHTAAIARPDFVPFQSTWFESYLESTDAGKTFSNLMTVDPTSIKTGPICTQTSCSTDGELGHFQTVTLNPTNEAYIAYDRVTGPGTVQTMCVTQSTNIEAVAGC
jgi:hypothetical protein